MITTDTVKVRETLHHGKTRDVREFVMDVSWQGFVNLLQSSKYRYGRLANDNPYIARAFAKLLTEGRCEHGWSNFEVIE